MTLKKGKEPVLMSNGCRERTEFNSDYDFLANGAFVGLKNPVDTPITKEQFLNPNTLLAQTCSDSAVYSRLKAGAYFTLNRPKVDLENAKLTIIGVWKYRNAAKYTEVESHPVVNGFTEDYIICQQRPYEPTTEVSVCASCSVRVNLDSKGQDCLFAGKFFPRERL